MCSGEGCFVDHMGRSGLVFSSAVRARGYVCQSRYVVLNPPPHTQNRKMTLFLAVRSIMYGYGAKANIKGVASLDLFYAAIGDEENAV